MSKPNPFRRKLGVRWNWFPLAHISNLPTKKIDWRIGIGISERERVDASLQGWYKIRAEDDGHCLFSNFSRLVLFTQITKLKSKRKSIAMGYNNAQTKMNCHELQNIKHQVQMKKQIMKG